MPSVIVLDVNETLLDLSALDPAFEEVFGSAEVRPRWFAQMLQLAFVGAISERYVDFGTAQRAAARMLAAQRGLDLSDDQVEELVGGMTRLPAHPEVPAALERLAASPLRVVALTNSTQAVADAQLEFSGLRPHLDVVMSADTVRALKPAAAAYRSVAERFGVDVAELRLVAAHAWDVSGALAAGCAAAFVSRSGAVPSPLGPQPDIVGADVADVVDQVLARDAG